MTKREMTSLLIKLMGIYALVLFVPQFVQSLGYLVMTAQQYTSLTLYILFLLIVIGFVTPGIWIALCVVVIVKSDWFARCLYREDAPAGQLTTLGFRDLQLLGVYFIGLLLIVRTIPHAIYIITSFTNPPYASGPDDILITLLSPAVQLAIGLYLFLYPQGLANLWALIQGKSKPYAEKDRTES